MTKMDIEPMIVAKAAETAKEGANRWTGTKIPVTTLL